jgi:general L-amino acid transport system substrate-binding protein
MKKIRRSAFGAVALATLSLVGISGFAGEAAAQNTLATVKQRGVLHCGVSPSLTGFAAPDSQGKWSGLDVDTCRAVAAAVLGSADKVRFFPYNAQQRFPAIQSGEVEVLSRNTTATLTRTTPLGLIFAPPNYYDGQGFLVPTKLGVKSAKELEGATVCVQPGTTTELNLADYFRASKMTFKPVVIADQSELEAAFFAGRCDVLTSDGSQLASIRASRAGNANDFKILPEIISKEPLSPGVRANDPEWYQIVFWTTQALVEAEERGITQANVNDMKKSDDPVVKRLLGVTPGLGKALGLDEEWAARAIAQVGNYGEIFERNVGQGSSLKLDRGVNALWTKGGLQYAWPLR